MKLGAFVKPGVLCSLVLLALSPLASGPLALAADPPAWPSGPVRLIVPYAAGGFADTRARKIGEQLSRHLGQPVVVDNKPGAGGVIGTDAIAKATDGQTFGMGSPAPLVTNPVLMKKLPYDAARDLKPVILIERAPLILVTANNQPFQTLGQLLDAARSKPGTLTYGSSGVGGAHHLSGEMLAFDSKTELVHVPYKGGAPAATDLMGGHLAFMFEMGYSALPSIAGKKVRPLAVSGSERLKQLPDVPTVAQAGVPGFESYNWLGVIAPASTPEPVVRRLNEAIRAALQDPGVRRMIEDSGGTVVGGSAQEFETFLGEERARWTPLIKSTGITIQ